jgi:hypothetical protein
MRLTPFEDDLLGHCSPAAMNGRFKGVTAREREAPAERNGVLHRMSLHSLEPHSPDTTFHM